MNCNSNDKSKQVMFFIKQGDNTTKAEGITGYEREGEDEEKGK